jgi:hypothetical protein
VGKSHQGCRHQARQLARPSRPSTLEDSPRIAICRAARLRQNGLFRRAVSVKVRGCGPHDGGAAHTGGRPTQTSCKLKLYMRGICSRRRVVICPTGAYSKILSSPLCKNISLHPSGKSSLQIRAIPPHKRGVGHRHERGVGCGGRGSVLRATGLQGRLRPVSDRQHADERCCSVRRSRVVLTPRRWRQVRGCCVGPTGRGYNVGSRATVAKQPGHRGEREGTR